MKTGLRVAVLVKQVPQFEKMVLGPDGRLCRDGVELEMNPYCRRAVAKGVDLAGTDAGHCTVFTLGPPAAEDTLREAVAWGAGDAVHVCDQAFAGSDTLATARALAAALAKAGPFDLVLAGLNSVDSDTGQVGPEVAELLGLPFLAGVRELTIDDGGLVRALCEHDDCRERLEVRLPAVLSCAERLCSPAKKDPGERAMVPMGLIARVAAADLGPGPWGQAGSPTRVGEVRTHEHRRDQVILDGTPAEQVAEAVKRLADAGALAGATSPRDEARSDGAEVADGWARGDRTVLVVAEPGRSSDTRALLGTAADLARHIGGRVEAVVPQPPAQAGQASLPSAGTLGRWGADQVRVLAGVHEADDVSPCLAARCAAEPPWAVLAASTSWGREVAARTSAATGAGLTGDAVGLEAVPHPRREWELTGWKPAFGGALVAAITAMSPTHLVTVRPGVLPLLRPRTADGSAGPQVTTIDAVPRGRIRLLERHRDDDLDTLAMAQAVVGVGAGVDPGEYDALKPLLDVLKAELAASRKVTDQGWQPRARQVGITGRSISPRLYVAIGLSGKLNHSIGARAAGTVLAINTDRAAPVFGYCDVGIVGDWHELVPLLAVAVAVGVSR
jgi:electron transfer flavoprotein alpha subunit